MSYIAFVQLFYDFEKLCRMTLYILRMCHQNSIVQATVFILLCNGYLLILRHRQTSFINRIQSFIAIPKSTFAYF
jgi:hypothetical protein